MDAKFCELLITGFLRDAEQLMNEQIIPQSLNKLCFNYFYAQLLLVAIHNSFVTIADIENNINWKYNIAELSLKMENAATCYAKNVTIPSSILSKLQEETTQAKIYETKHDIIFHSNRYYQDTKYISTCKAYIINPACIHSSKNNHISVYETRLPNILNVTIRANDLIFCHETKSLISMGGIIGNIINGYSPTNNVFELIFNDNDSMEWKPMPNLNVNRSSSTSIFVDDKCIVIGGQGNMFSVALDNVEIYDMVNKKWKILKSVNHKRMACGVYYDNMSQHVWICGGFDGTDYVGVRTVEFYDFQKHKWYNNLPDTVENHDYYPLLWSQDHNVLNVASITAKAIETLDLRENGKKWIVHHSEQKFDAIFGTDIQSSNAARYRLFA